MTDTEQIIAMAELDGWCLRDEGWYHQDCPIFRQAPPNYLNDLNAVARVAQKLSPEQLREYHWILTHLMDWKEGGPDSWALAIDATARQRTEAILRATGKWRDGE